MDRAVYTPGSPTFDPDDLGFDSGCETWKIQIKEDIKQLPMPKGEDFRRKLNCFIEGTYYFTSVKIRAGHIQNRWYTCVDLSCVSFCGRSIFSTRRHSRFLPSLSGCGPCHVTGHVTSTAACRACLVFCPFYHGCGSDSLSAACLLDKSFADQSLPRRAG